MPTDRSQDNDAKQDTTLPLPRGPREEATQWIRIAPEELKQHQNIRLQFDEDKPNIFYYAIIISTGQTQTKKLSYIRVRWGAGCPFEHDTEKMSMQQYIPYKDLKRHYTVWVEAPTDLPQETKSQNKVIQIKTIIDAKVEHDKQYYKVVWADRPVEEASWVAADQLENSEELISHFTATKKRKRASTRQYQTAHAMTQMIAGADTRAPTLNMDDLQDRLSKRVQPLRGRPHQNIIMLSYDQEHNDEHPFDRRSSSDINTQVATSPTWRADLLRYLDTTSVWPSKGQQDNVPPEVRKSLQATQEAKLYRIKDNVIVRCAQLELLRDMCAEQH